MSKRYLLKFVKEYSHAQMLVNGELFSRPSRYFRQLELGIGDQGEGTIFPGVCIYTHSDNLIYCMYDSYELVNNLIVISKKNFNDFSFNYVVVVSYDAMEKALSHNFKDNVYEIRSGNVQYGQPSFDYQSELFTSNSPENLFIKHPYFKHQQEYRIYCAQSIKDADSKVLKLNDDISNNCKIFRREDLFETGDSFVLDIDKIGF